MEDRLVTRKFWNFYDSVSVHFVNANVGWIVGGNGTIIQTTDGGNTWVNQPVEQPVVYTPVHLQMKIQVGSLELMEF